MAMELRVGNKYRLGRKIGGGSFGDIYQGVNVNTGEEYAVCPAHSTNPQNKKKKAPAFAWVSVVAILLLGVVGEFSTLLLRSKALRSSSRISNKRKHAHTRAYKR